MSTDKSPRVADYIGHMIAAAQRILDYTKGLTRGEFLANTLVQDGVIRNFEVIGEAARNVELVAPAFVQQHSDIAWAGAQGMRHRLTHGYFRVDFDIVWVAIQRDIPELLHKLQSLQPALGK